MRLLFLCILCFEVVSTQAQGLDSLKIVLTKTHGSDYANTAKSLATNYLRQNLYDSAETYYDLAINGFKQIGDNKQVGKCLNNKGVSNYLRGRFKDAVGFYQEAINYYEQAENDTLVAKAKTNLGITFKGLNLYEKSLQNLYEGAAILESLDLKKELSANWNAIGNIHRGLNNLELSLKYLKRSLNLRREIGYEKGIGQSLQNIGIWHISNEDYPEAYVKLLEALKVLSRLDKRTSASTLAQLGQVMMTMDSIKGAEVYFKKSLKLRLEMQDENGMAVSSNHLASLYLETKRYSEAFTALKTAEEFGNKSNSLEEIASTYKLFKDYHTDQGSYRTALVYAHQLSAVRNEIIDEEKARSFIESEIRYEVDRKEKEILSQKSELISTRLKTTWLISAIVILLLIVAALVWFYLLLKRLANQRKISKERVEGLLKELNHRTKNHLQSQLSLIKLQSGFLKDRSAKNVMREVGNRMKAITLIHQSLYDSSEEEPENINLSEYLRNLTENLMISFKYNRNKVALTYDFEEIDIDLHYAVPIGLIVNEAVTNAFKYAFTSEIQSPALKLSLKRNESHLSVCVKDNGQGFTAKDQVSQETLGMTIIKDLAGQLNGQLKIEDKTGVAVGLVFPIQKKRSR